MSIQSSSPPQHPPVYRPSTWTPPPFSQIKINFNAAVNKHHGFGAITGIARNNLGHPIAWFCKRIIDIIDPMVLESLACHKAALLAKNKSFHLVFLEGDAQLVIQATKGGIIQSDLHGIFNDIAHLSSELSDITFNCVPRACNSTAHNIAKKMLQDDSFACNPLEQTNFVFFSLN
ncbi:hypothetical protein P3X46_000657 [Hevea brasiliensis]|uniref:RNase H type-1 domain-containing protein n=1 Tax=Hevea brasiliensis TaxID=3981 RepID=A0ABQ9NA06_HEVBR|nr:uncharacterized protein LOC131183159 [Hevea brasiliensis]KAJ9189349.1 hypothetical protein P3X46_000657 [Hevea brasiliensis]